jgi:hypothetical protein
LHLGTPRRRVNAIENHFHQQMVIWRSLSPSILARVLAYAAARLVAGRQKSEDRRQKVPDAPPVN